MNKSTKAKKAKIEKEIADLTEVPDSTFEIGPGVVRMMNDLKQKQYELAEIDYEEQKRLKGVS